MGMLKVDVLGHAVTSIRCSADGNAVLVSCLDGWIRMVDRADGRVLKGFGGVGGGGRGSVEYINKELRIRSTFAKGESVVLSGSEGAESAEEKGNASVFAWDVLTGDVVTTIRAGEAVKVVSCVAWNEKGGCWAGGCSDGNQAYL
jgi:mitogen-activated protein kinase organizer 1